MAKLLLEPLDFVRHESGALGIVLPCGKVITLEKFSDGFKHCTLETTGFGNLQLITDMDIPTEVRFAFDFVRTAFSVNYIKSSPKNENSLFGEWIGKRVILFTKSSNRINFVGTLKHAEGTVVKLTEVTPMRNTRSMPDMVTNIANDEYTELVLVTDPNDDPYYTLGL